MRENKSPGERRRDPFLRLTGAQLLLCAVILLLAYGAMRWNAPLFDAMRAEFAALTEKDYDVGGFRFFDFGSAREKQAPDVSPAGETAASGQDAVDADAVSSDAVFSDATEDVSPAAPDAENTGGADAGAGGADLTAAEAAGELSFAFYDTGSAVVLPVQGSVTSGFGERVHPVYGTQGFHSGTDLAADEGTPVHAAMDGVVLAVGVGEKSGNYVRLGHDHGVETLYCHLQGANVREGVTVRRGDVIGFVGQTGLATGPHLHFEVIIDGVKYDPAHLLEDAAVVS